MKAEFEVGKEYERDGRVFLCSEREGDHVVLTEVGGASVIEGDVVKADVGLDGYNECVKVGVVQRDGFKAIQYIVAHDFNKE